MPTTAVGPTMPGIASGGAFGYRPTLDPTYNAATHALGLGTGTLTIDFTNPGWGGAVNNDWTGAIQAVQDALGSAPYVLTAPVSTRAYGISKNFYFGPGQVIQGGGGGQIFLTSPGLTFRCLTAGAGITISAVGGMHSGWRVDGNNIATNPLTIGTLLQPGDGGTFIDVSALNAVTASWTIIYAQNHAFICCGAVGSAQDNIVVTGGAGGHSFYRFEEAGCVRYGWRVDASSATFEGVQYPLYLNWNHCFMEQEFPGAGVTRVYVDNGGSGDTGPLVLQFDDCNIVSSAADTGPSVVVKGNSQLVKFHNPSITCSPVGGLAVYDTCTVELSNPLWVSTGASAACYLLESTTAAIAVTGADSIEGAFTATYGGPHAAAQDAIVTYQTIHPLVVGRQAAGDVVLRATYAALAGQLSFADFADGLRWYYNAANNPDTYIGPASVVGGGPPNGGGLATNKGMGFWLHAPPVAQPATPVTLSDVIAVLQSYGLTA